MERRTFLAAAAALGTLPTGDATSGNADSAGSDGAACAICGEQKPAAMVDRTTVVPIAPREATICRACQHVYNYAFGAGRCLRCGGAVGSGFGLAVRFPLGQAGLPGRLAGQFCGECAGWLASEITHTAIDADPAASRKLRAILDAERRLADTAGED